MACDPATLVAAASHQQKAGNTFPQAGAGAKCARGWWGGHAQQISPPRSAWTSPTSTPEKLPELPWMAGSRPAMEWG